MDTHRPATIREWDRQTIEDLGLPGIALMENAGAAAARIIGELHERHPADFPPPFVILCGPGNNGGDGYVVARHLESRGLDVEVWLCFDRRRLARDSDAGVNLTVIERMGLPIHAATAPYGPLASDDLSRPSTIVDALLGTGLSRPLADPFLGWVRLAAESGRPVIALDTPTGLDGDTGEVAGAVLPARHTITFAAAKRGFLAGVGPESTGKVHIVDIGIPRSIRDRDPADTRRREP
jgi:NAD(P)H-hydrate epimerase